MTLRRMQLAVYLAVGFCLFLPACRKEGGGGGGKMAHLTVTLSKDANGYCVQKLNGAATAVVSLDAGDTVTFESKTGGPFLLNFPAANVGSCNSPFRDASGNCQSRFDNSNPNSGPAVGPPSTPFPYGTLSLNGATCNLNIGPQPLGMRMR